MLGRSTHCIYEKSYLIILGLITRHVSSYEREYETEIKKNRHIYGVQGAIIDRPIMCSKIYPAFHFFDVAFVAPKMPLDEAVTVQGVNGTRL